MSPKSTKTPQDHKPKAGPRQVIIGSVTVEVDPAALDSFELLDDLDRIDQGNALRVASAMRRVVGPKQLPTVMDTLRDPETGRVSNEAAATFLIDLVRELSPNS